MTSNCAAYLSGISTSIIVHILTNADFTLQYVFSATIFELSAQISPPSSTFSLTQLCSL
jgi:hypothetical protein